MKTKIEDRSEKVTLALSEKGLMMNRVHVNNGTMVKCIEHWSINGAIYLLEKFSGGGYQLFRPINDSLKIQDDVDFINSLS